MRAPDQVAESFQVGTHWGPHSMYVRQCYNRNTVSETRIEMTLHSAGRTSSLSTCSSTRFRLANLSLLVQHCNVSQTSFWTPRSVMWHSGEARTCYRSARASVGSGEQDAAVGPAETVLCVPGLKSRRARRVDSRSGCRWIFTSCARQVVMINLMHLQPNVYCRTATAMCAF